MFNNQSSRAPASIDVWASVQHAVTLIAIILAGASALISVILVRIHTPLADTHAAEAVSTVSTASPRALLPNELSFPSFADKFPRCISASDTRHAAAVDVVLCTARLLSVERCFVSGIFTATIGTDQKPDNASADMVVRFCWDCDHAFDSCIVGQV